MLSEFLKRGAFGEDSCITLKRCGRIFQRTPRELQSMKYDEVVEGNAVIGTCQHGIYYISNLEELNKTIANYKSRIRAMAKYVKALKKNYEHENQLKLLEE